MADKEKTTPSMSKVLMSKAQEAVGKALEEYNAGISKKSEESVSTLPNPIPGSETLEERFEKPNFSGVAGRRTRVKSDVGIAGWGLGSNYPGLVTYAPGTSYLNNKEIYHSARARLRYSNKKQVTPLVRGTRSNDRTS